MLNLLLIYYHEFVVYFERMHRRCLLELVGTLYLIDPLDDMPSHVYKA